MSTIEPGRNDLWDQLYGVLSAPQATFARIGEGRWLTWGLLVFAAGELPAMLSAPAAQGRAGALAQLVGALLAVFLFAGLVQMAARAFRLSAPYRHVASCLLFAALPGLLAAPLLVLGALVTPLAPLGDLAQFACGLWTLFLVVIGVRTAFATTTGRAVGLLASAVGLLCAIILSLLLVVAAVGVGLVLTGVRP
ncbi:MAG TPA: YIP1 family protein [Limnochordia bacterium]|nr:YIP1 family protein [Limnochordia bacterium]